MDNGLPVRLFLDGLRRRAITPDHKLSIARGRRQAIELIHLHLEIMDEIGHDALEQTTQDVRYISREDCWDLDDWWICEECGAAWLAWQRISSLVIWHNPNCPICKPEAHRIKC